MVEKRKKKSVTDRRYRHRTHKIAVSSILLEKGSVPFFEIAPIRDSMESIGLQFPISITPLDVPIGKYKYKVVHGNKRLSAALYLGWKVIPALIVPDLEKFKGRKKVRSVNKKQTT